MKNPPTIWGYDEQGQQIYISQAISNKEYKCECGGRLRVRHGKIRVKHFYHVRSAKCSYTRQPIDNNIPNLFSHLESTSITKNDNIWIYRRFKAILHVLYQWFNYKN